MSIEDDKKLAEEAKKFLKEFQSRSVFNMRNISSRSRPKTKLVLVFVGIILILIFVAYFHLTTGGNKVKIKAPDGYEIIYPPNAPPKLIPKK